MIVNGRIESHWSRKTGQWSPLKFIRDPYLHIHQAAPALNYGVQAYEGLKAFRMPGDSAIAVFRPDRNARRMRHSAEFISVPPVPDDLFLAAVKAAIALNAEYVPPHDTGAAMYVRPLVLGTSAQLGLNPPDEYTFMVYVLPTGVYHGTKPVRALIIDEFDRAAPNGTGSAKVGGNYAPVLRWSEKARNEGYGITLHLDSKRHEVVDEFSTSGFIGAIVDGDQVTLVVPDSKAVIDSVTSDSVQRIGEGFGWKIEKREVSFVCPPSALLAWQRLTPRSDPLFRAAQLLGGHGGGHRRRSRVYPVHLPPRHRFVASTSPRVGEGRRGDGHLHPRAQRGAWRALC